MPAMLPRQRMPLSVRACSGSAHSNRHPPWAGGTLGPLERRREAVERVKVGIKQLNLRLEGIQVLGEPEVCARRHSTVEFVFQRPPNPF